MFPDHVTRNKFFILGPRVNKYICVICSSDWELLHVLMVSHRYSLAGYTGSNCATQINLCATNPCGQGATCAPLVNGYQCTCPSGKPVLTLIYLVYYAIITQISRCIIFCCQTSAIRGSCDFGAFGLLRIARVLLQGCLLQILLYDIGGTVSLQFGHIYI